MSERCSEGIRGSGTLFNGKWVRRQCARPGTVQRSGKWFCGTHDPDARAERAAKRLAKSQAKWDWADRAREFTCCCESVCVAAGVTLEDLRQGRVRVTVISHDMEQQP